ncbi:MAG: glycosyltransferase family 2 protein [Thermoflexales bacterium]|nr:glycosyltransferase family 2 protein [Thermoflexales bacterium]
MKLDLSVVVCIYNGEEYLRRCVEALLAQGYPRDRYEIILVDDGSRDSSRQICETILDRHAGQLPKLAYVYQKNAGLANARNTGIYLAQGEIVAFIDQDAVAHVDWLSRLLEGFSTDQLAVVGGRIELLNRESQIARFNHIVRYHQEFGPKEYVSHIIGANMAYRCPIVRQIGGFHPYFRYRGDETNLVRRLLAQGYTFGVAPQAIVYHKHQDSVSLWMRTEYQEGHLMALIENTTRGTAKRQLKTAALNVERLVIASLPLWLLVKHNWLGRLALGVSCLAFARQHVLMKGGRAVLERLVREYRGLALLLVPFHLLLFWFRTTLRMAGRLRGAWDYRGYHLARPEAPDGSRIEQILYNRESEEG